MLERMFTMICDECNIHATESFWYAAKAREEAKEEGWVRRQQRDLCPECAKAVA